MSNDVPTNGLLGVTTHEGSAIDLGYHLVRDEDCDAKLISQSLQHPKKFG